MNNSILPRYEVKELPSRFLGYPKGTRIFVQPYTAGQAMNIELAGRNNISTMDEILSGVHIEGFDKMKLTPQDILFLGVYRNLVSSKHDKINVNSICPKCLYEGSDVKTLGAIKFKEIEGFDEECYPIEVDFDHYTMKFEFLSYDAYQYCYSRFKGAKLYQMAMQVVSYYDKDKKESYDRPKFSSKPSERRSTANFDNYISKVRQILFNLVDEDKDALDQVIEILEDYGTKPIEVTCKECNHQYSVNLDDDNVLVTPFRDTEESPRARVKLRKSDIDRPVDTETNESEGSGNVSGTGGGTSEQQQQPVTSLPKKKQDQIQYFDK